MPDHTQPDAWFGAESSTFGDRLAGAREQMGMSRAELAQRLGVETTTLSAWEEDLSEPRANKLQMLAGVLNVSLTWLLTAEGDGVSMPSASPGDVDDLEPVLLEMRQITADVKRFATRMTVLEKRLRQVMKERETPFSMEQSEEGY